ncbi:MAG: FHA domain-containing protein [Chloroflexota bacterium]|nr:FHA domain-containing protein [Chloroflexota bacterium]
MAIHCPNCGTDLPDGVAFCDVCGTPLRGQNQAPAAQVFAPASAVSMGSVACPVCGASALPGEAFCDNCGASLLGPAPTPSVAAPVPAPGQQASPPPPTYSSAPVGAYAAPVQVGASLVINSPPPPATLPVPDRPELIVGRSDPQSNSYPDIDLGPYGGLELGISRRHFRLARNGGQFYLEDLGSMNGTVVNGQRIPPHTMHPLRPGDRIITGKMELTIDLT